MMRCNDSQKFVHLHLKENVVRNVVGYPPRFKSCMFNIYIYIYIYICVCVFRYTYPTTLGTLFSYNER